MLLRCISDGLALITWEQDSFAFADSFDEDAGRYRGLRAGERIEIPTPMSRGCSSNRMSPASSSTRK